MATYPASIDFVMGDGTTVGLALNFSGLAIFEQKKKDDKELNEVYACTNKMVSEGLSGLLETGKALYGCYLINLWNENPRMILKDKSVMSLNDWFERLGDDWDTIYKVGGFLSNPKYRAAFVESLEG